MKNLRQLFLVLGIPLLSLSAWAQTKAVLKTISTNTLLEGFTVPNTANAIAPAWKLSAFAGVATLSPSEIGFGWDDTGRFTFQTAAGVLQIYSSGSPAVPSIYLPGRLDVTTLNAGTLTGSLTALSITAGSGGFDGLNAAVIDNSLLSPLKEWQGRLDRAGVSGIPQAVDTQGSGGNEFVDGTYWPQALVTGATASTSIIAGRYRTSAQAKTDLAIAAADLTATGTKDATTFLRGDNTWAVPAGGGGGAVTSVAGRTGAVTLSTADISGLGTAATTAASAYEVAGAAATAQAAANGYTNTQLVDYLYGGNNLSDLPNIPAARTSLGLGTAATKADATAPVRLVSTTATLTTADGLVWCSGTSYTLTLPAANSASPRAVVLQVINNASGNLTITCSGSDLIDGLTSITVAPQARISIGSNAATAWTIF